MRRVLKQVRQRAMSTPLEDTEPSRDRTHYSRDLSSLLDRIDHLISPSRIPTHAKEIQ
jgi:hypothetical protein